VRSFGSLSQNRAPCSRTTRLRLKSVAHVLAHLATLVTTGLLCHSAGTDNVCADGPRSMTYGSSTPVPWPTPRNAACTQSLSAFPIAVADVERTRHGLAFLQHVDVDIRE
jgi:hypothetical protein